MGVFCSSCCCCVLPLCISGIRNCRRTFSRTAKEDRTVTPSLPIGELAGKQVSFELEPTVHEISNDVFISGKEAFAHSSESHACDAVCESDTSPSATPARQSASCWAQVPCCADAACPPQSQRGEAPFLFGGADIELLMLARFRHVGN